MQNEMKRCIFSTRSRGLLAKNLSASLRKLNYNLQISTFDDLQLKSMRLMGARPLN